MLDAARVTFPLILRYASRGDRFVPFGMNGTKLVSDFLTDQKRTIIEKERQLVVENANGDIIWLVNNRPDNRYRITAQTQKVMSLSMTYDL
jgi:tRNA(Ile)-lysidine synthase